MTLPELLVSPSLPAELQQWLMTHPSSPLPASLNPVLEPARELLNTILQLRKLCLSDIHEISKSGSRRHETMRGRVHVNDSIDLDMVDCIATSYTRDEIHTLFLLDCVRACTVLVSIIVHDPNALSAFAPQSWECSATGVEKENMESFSSLHQPFDDSLVRQTTYSYPHPSRVHPPLIRLPPGTERKSRAEKETSIKDLLWRVSHVKIDLEDPKINNSSLFYDGSMSPESPHLIMPDYVWSSEIYGNGVTIVNWLGMRLEQVRN